MPGEISFKFHLGEMYYKLKPGQHKVIDVVGESCNVTRYKRLSKNSLNSKISTKAYVLAKESTRYDFRIYTPESYFKYKVFIEKDEEGNSFFKEDHDAKQVVNDLRVGPGYFIWPEYSTARFDVIDCKLNRTMRLKIKGFKSNPTFKKNMEVHSQRLKESFFDKLCVISGTTDLSIPDIKDERYILSYVRKSVCQHFDVPGTDIILKTSDETLLKDYDVVDEEEGIYDVFVENKVVNSLLESDDWEADDLVTHFESVFNLGKELMQEIAAE